MLTAFMIVPPELRLREVIGVVSPVTRGIDDEPRQDCFPPDAVIHWRSDERLESTQAATASPSLNIGRSGVRRPRHASRHSE